MKELTTKSDNQAPARKYQCPECGLHYQDQEIAKKCEVWCREHKSCNLDYIQYSEEAKAQV